MSDLIISRLTMTYLVGFAEDETPIYKQKQYRNVHPTASNEELLGTAQALASLQKFPLDAVERNNTYDLA